MLRGLGLSRRCGAVQWAVEVDSACGCGALCPAGAALAPERLALPAACRHQKKEARKERQWVLDEG